MHMRLLVSGQRVVTSYGERKATQLAESSGALRNRRLVEQHHDRRGRQAPVGTGDRWSSLRALTTI